MTSIVHRYVDAVADQLRGIVDRQTDAIDAAAHACADSIEGDGLVFSFGTGHGGFAALEMFPRTGTIAGFRPIVELPIALMHHVFGDMGTHQYRFLHKQEGLRHGDPAPTASTWRHDDPVLAVRPQRRDPRHRRRVQAARPHGRRRHVGDALQRRRVAPFLGAAAVRGRRRRRRHRRADGRRRTGARGDGALFGPTSTPVAVVVAHSIVARTAELLLARGYQPKVMRSPNVTDYQTANANNDEVYEDLWRRLSRR